METLDKIVNSFSEKIVTIDNEVEFLKNSLENQQESQRLIAINSIKAIENKIYTLESKNKILLKLIPEEKNNLALWQLYEQAIDIKAAIQNLQQEKDTLELQDTEVYIKADSKYVQLQQEKDALELQVKLAKDQTNSTQPIRELVTSEIKTNTRLIILIGTILGFIFSVFIVFIRQAFLKEQN